jgi:hypothetical protein
MVKTMEQVRLPSHAFRHWRELGAFAALVPSLGNLSDVALTTLDELPWASAGGRNLPQRTSNRIAALFLDVRAVDARAALVALRFSKHDVNWSAALAERWQSLGPEIERALSSGDVSDVDVRRWLARVGRLYAGAFLRVANARWQAQRDAGVDAPSDAAVRALHRQMRRSLYRDPLALADLSVGGDDLARAGIPAGPIYAKILHALLERVLEDPACNTPDALLAEVPQLVASFGGSSGSAVHPSTDH